jgi:heme-degrading monooxygenase HmoA
MTVLMRAEVPGMTADQFEVLFAPLIDQLKGFPGFIANASGPVPEGYQVTEVWESQETHERWVREVIMPAMERAGLTRPPSIQYAPLARFFTP